MKKKFALRAMALVLTLIFAVSAFTVFSSAAIVPGKFRETEAKYTSRTNTYGYSSWYYTGEYEKNGSGQNRLRIYAESGGGSASQFLSSVYIEFSYSVPNGSVSVYKDTDETGVRYANAYLEYDSGSFYGSGVGYTEHHCTSKTDSSDNWKDNSLYRWVDMETGWREG